MNELDYVIAIIVIVSAVMGLWRGFFSEVLALAIWIVAFWVAWSAGPGVSVALEAWIELPFVRIIGAYAACFIVVLIAGAWVRFLFARLIKTTGLSGTDRMLGLGFGVIRGVFVVAIGVFMMGFTPIAQGSLWQNSRLLPVFAATATWLGDKVPVENRAYFHHFAQGAAAGMARPSDADSDVSSSSDPVASPQPDDAANATNDRHIHEPIELPPRESHLSD